MFKGFRDFILRGNVLDLAVGVIIGVAFSAVVSSLAADVLTPIIGLLFGNPDFSALNRGSINFGNLVSAIITFLITALALYFFIVVPANRLIARFKPQEPEPQPTRTCPECLSNIPVAAKRCSFCTTRLEPQERAVGGATAD